METSQDLQEALSRVARQIYFLKIKEGDCGSIKDAFGSQVGNWIVEKN